MPVPDLATWMRASQARRKDASVIGEERKELEAERQADAVIGTVIARVSTCRATYRIVAKHSPSGPSPQRPSTDARYGRGVE